MQRGLDIGRIGGSLSEPGGMADGGISDPSVSSDRGYGLAGSKCSLSGNQCVSASDGDGVGIVRGRRNSRDKRNNRNKQNKRDRSAKKGINPMLDLHPCRRKDRYAVVPFISKDEYQISHTDPIPVLFIYRFYRIAAPLPPYILNR